VLPGDSCVETDVAAALHVLSVLDEISPGSRLAMALTCLERSPSAAVASKAALMLGRRVANPLRVERQMMVTDARIRANVIESLWGVNSSQARRTLRKSLHDPHNRVVANALVGLHMLRDLDAAARLKAMITHPDPRFRVSAAWAMGRTGDRSLMDSLRLALEDSEAAVRASAARALEALTADS
jgi:HEAT repeat protein